MPSSTRPPEIWSSVAAVIAVIAGVRPGIWKIADPSLIFSVCPASHASTVGRPDRVEAERLGLADLSELLGRGQPESPVPDVEP